MTQKKSIPIHTDIKNRLDFAKHLIKKSADLAQNIRATYTGQFVQEKSTQNLVTVADKAVDDLWRNKIPHTFTHDTILTEEGTENQRNTASKNADSLWVLDPIDGTSNFTNAIPIWGISIAYIKNAVPMIGVLYFPEQDLLLWAIKGYGAFANNSPIAVSKKQDPTRSSVIFSRSANWKIEDHIDTIRRIDRAGMVYRFFGCASYSLACVAMGKTQMYYEPQVSIWDVLAGLIIVDEAGGKGQYNTSLKHFLSAPADVIAHNNQGIHKILV